ncbi:MAG: hypothetical protein ACLFOY_14910 [Desulfatibacillaceae bacterium]
MSHKSTTIRLSVVAMLLLAAAFAGSCRQRHFVPPTNDYIPRVRVEKMIPLDASIWIAPVFLAENAGKLHSTSREVFPEQIRDAIRTILEEKRMFRTVSYHRMVEQGPPPGDDGETPKPDKPEEELVDFELHTLIGVVDHSGYNSTTARVMLQYVLNEAETGQVVWRRNIFTKYEISAAEIQWWIGRQEQAYAGAVRTNVFRMSKELTEFVRSMM